MRISNSQDKDRTQTGQNQLGVTSNFQGRVLSHVSEILGNLGSKSQLSKIESIWGKFQEGFKASATSNEEVRSNPMTSQEIYDISFELKMPHGVDRDSIKNTTPDFQRVLKELNIYVRGRNSSITQKDVIWGKTRVHKDSNTVTDKGQLRYIESHAKALPEPERKMFYEILRANYSPMGQKGHASYVGTEERRIGTNLEKSLKKPPT